MEGYFLGKSLDVDEQITSVSDVTTLVIGVVSISGSYRDGEFLSREVIFLNKVSIDTGNVYTTVDQRLGSDDFHRVQGDNQLNGDLHRFGLQLYCYTSTQRGNGRTLRHGGPPF